MNVVSTTLRLALCLSAASLPATRLCALELGLHPAHTDGCHVTVNLQTSLDPGEGIV